MAVGFFVYETLRCVNPKKYDESPPLIFHSADIFLAIAAIAFGILTIYSIIPIMPSIGWCLIGGGAVYAFLIGLQAITQLRRGNYC